VLGNKHFDADTEARDGFADCFSTTLDFLTSKPVVVVPSADQVSSDAGLLPFRQLDEWIGLTRQFAEALSDRRNVGCIDHSFLEMTRLKKISDSLLKQAIVQWEATGQPQQGTQDRLTGRVVVELSASWPYLDHFRQVVQRLLAISSAAPNSS
jgi:hypothetical protein